MAFAKSPTKAPLFCTYGNTPYTLISGIKWHSWVVEFEGEHFLIIHDFQFCKAEAPGVLFQHYIDNWLNSFEIALNGSVFLQGRRGNKF